LSLTGLLKQIIILNIKIKNLLKMPLMFMYKNFILGNPDIEDLYNL